MFGLNKIAATVLAVGIGLAAIVAVTVAVMTASPDASAKKSVKTAEIEHAGTQAGSPNSGQNSANESSNSSEEIFPFKEMRSDTPAPNTPVAYYKGTVTITEEDTFEKNAQVSSKGRIKSTLTSEEILFYDNKTEKCYIMARKLSFEAKGSVSLKHEGGVFAGDQDVDSLGDIIELYDDLIKNNGGSLDYSNLPLRADIKEGSIFTIVPTKKQDWVATVTGKDVSMGPPMIFPPDSLENYEIGLIPGSPNILIERSYHASESVLDELSGMTVNPKGTFNCKYEKISESAAMAWIAMYVSESTEKEKNSLFKPELEQDSGDNNNANADRQEGLPLPEGYPQDVVPISSGAFVAISETVPGESGKNGFNVTLKVKQTKEETIKNYSKLLKSSTIFDAGGTTTITGEKGEYEYNVVISDNILGGSEKTMIQIVINPFED